MDGNRESERRRRLRTPETILTLPATISATIAKTRVGENMEHIANELSKNKNANLKLKQNRSKNIDPYLSEIQTNTNRTSPAAAISSQIVLSKTDLITNNVGQRWTNNENAEKETGLNRKEIEKNKDSTVEKNKPVKEKKQRYFMSLTKPEAVLLFFGIFSQLCGTVAGLLSPLFLKFTFDDAQRAFKNDTPETRAKVNASLYLVIGVQFTVPVFRVINIGLCGIAAERFLRRLRSLLFAVIIDQDISFFDETMTGELLSRMASDTEIMQKFVGTAFPQLCYGVFLVLASLVIMLITNWKLSLVFWGFFPVILILFILQSRIIKTKRARYQEILADAASIMHESVTQIRTLRAFSADVRTQGIFEQVVDSACKVGFQLVKVTVVFQFVMFVSYNASYVGFFVLAAYMIIWGQIDVFDVLEILLFALQAISGILILVDSVATTAESLGASSRIFDILRTRDEAMKSKDKMFKLLNRGTDVKEHDINDFDGTLSFKEIQFCYSTSMKLILKGVSFDIAEGQVVALVGSSGGGKSTIVSLIERFYEPQSGDIVVGGHSIGEVDAFWMRSNLISIVSQEPSLFSGTVASNIRYGRPDASMQQIEEVARDANAHDFILQLEGGYEAKTGERGVKLSGGQKQRIAIARALLMDAKIMLLDEATSALDAESEGLVQEAIDRTILLKGKTVLVVAHRLSTVRKANLILVIKDGEVAEKGNHESLMLKDAGIYRRLVEGQLTL